MWNAPSKNLRLEWPIAPIAGTEKNKGRLVKRRPGIGDLDQLTVNVNDGFAPVWVAPAAVPETVIVYAPAGVPGLPLCLLLLPPPQAGAKAKELRAQPRIRRPSNFFRREAKDSQLNPVSAIPPSGKNTA